MMVVLWFVPLAMEMGKLAGDQLVVVNSEFV
jgi:hypothetical protein